jgi:hypothetical protein
LGGIDQGKPVFGTFKGERDEAKVMGQGAGSQLSGVIQQDRAVAGRPHC